ncbi:MAG: methyl-accepting chemotaxis protein [Gomphosphaeria aponina SAG 52.96 = DSM 107014]|uniref:Methyl-accepting chemotaxis protein n=1 Tax=Gomphosphaeria aponina SAG 52.96 = DSM 107014 TaxID=1521640 RepID=A0A941GQR9_9CHRO|nr:methyl-accepting chemotaxis protein [Gomphosphaeria aponina SAG 52.96 = DSM 107014]
MPTIIAVWLRYFLYRHLRYLGTKVRRLIVGARQGEQPKIIENLEARFQTGTINLEQVNTGALIEAVYSQEKFGFFGLPLRCDPIDFFCRTLPNLLLSFGLLGTFLGMTINLANLTQTITQVDINDVRSLVEQLNQPLQGMGIAFITSLVAVACSAFLTVVNFTWNTSIAKSTLINSLEDYLDNVYLQNLPIRHPMDEAVDRLVGELSAFLHTFGETIQESLQKSIVVPVEKIVEQNAKLSEFATQVYTGLIDSSHTIEHSAESFSKAANVLDRSRFPEKLSSATADLSIAQNQFSQSSLVLKKSTQSIEYTLQAMQTSIQSLLNMGEEISSLNQKYATLVSLTEKRIVIEEAGLNEIKYELDRLIDKLKKI